MKRGFTLIELLAVIVILAIIAVIAVPIVLNIIDETKNNATLRSADFYLDAVEYTISDAYLHHGGLQDGDYPITSEGNLCKTALPCSEENTLKVQVNGEVPTSGTITITKGNISDLSIVLNDKTIVKDEKGNLVYELSNGKACTYVDSEDDTGDAIGKIDLSDIVTCGTESFYVMFNENNQITMLSKYNLEVGYIGAIYTDFSSPPFISSTIANPTGLQSKKTSEFVIEGNIEYLYGTLDFYQAEDELISYETHLKEKLKISSSKTSMMSLEQAVKLGCSSSEESCSYAPTWVYSTNYWIERTNNIGANGFFGGEDYIDPNLPCADGVRPVVTISIDEIQ